MSIGLSSQQLLGGKRRAAWAAILIALAAALLTQPMATALAQGNTPSSARLNGIRHVYQDWNNCGPANLTMALSYFGWSYGQGRAASFLKPTIEDKNVSPAEMVAFVNQEQTELPDVRALWRFGGTLDLLKRLIAAEFPVVVESGYDVEDLGWMGHYETVVAYDDAEQTVWVYDSYLGIGSGFGRTYSYQEFDEWWRHFNRTFLVFFPVDRTEELRSILGRYEDVTWATNTALNTALQEAAQDQSDGWAWFNAGVSAAKLGNYYDAAAYFDLAFAQGLPFRVTWYHFWPYEAYYRVGRYQDVIDLANNTETTTEYVEETYYWRGMAYAAQGRTGEAISEFERAVRYNRNFAAAEDARMRVEAGQVAMPSMTH
jgi:hypothetical protein